MLYSAPTTDSPRPPKTVRPTDPSQSIATVVLLDAVDLRFSYRPTGGNRTRRAPNAINGVSLTVDPGAIVGVLGPNGSGKTTLIRLLSGALTPASGAVTFDHRPLTGLPRHVLARRLAVVPQETHLAFDYTVLEIVLMGRYPRLGAFEIEGPEDIRVAMDALAATGTQEFAPRPFPTLSGGEKQRVIIASALAQLDDRGSSSGQTDRLAAPSSLLFLDEPTASLDLRYQLELVALLRRLNAELGITMILSTHDLRLAASLCTKVVLLSQGAILAEGSAAEVLTAELIGRLYGVDRDAVAPILA
jgi:iron complex transport system ATP-binding protein